MVVGANLFASLRPGRSEANEFAPTSAPEIRIDQVALHREWFVRLRFPGHEHTRIIDGVPEGWQRTNFGDLCDAVVIRAHNPVHSMSGSHEP